MASGYMGMRWLKCDLQMQTPADSRHWQGKPLNQDNIEETAEEFADACFKSGLDVIGITDHNFLSMHFIPSLQQALKRLEAKYQREITLFPGFEFEAAGVGRGVHVLALFEPSTDLSLLDSILTECGIRYPRVKPNGQLEKSDKNLKEVLSIVQGKHSGIVIMPHATSNDGIFDDESISEWLQQDQFTNPELLAIEVPKPVEKMSNGFQKLLASGDGCHPDWRRERAIATIMSSDNKTLLETDDNGAPAPNSIGYRYSWIKMSVPSVESLRQAFLDHESRIILPADVSKNINPKDLTRQARIRSLEIKNVAFLADQKIHFSQNVNCIIGGRGSGKSTLLEYLRVIFNKHESQDIDLDTKGKISRIRETLTSSEAQLKAVWEGSEGVEDQILWNNGELSLGRDDVFDPDTFFEGLPIRFFSQQQLNRLTESKAEADVKIPQAQRLLELIDGFARKELNELSDREKELRSRAYTSLAEQRRVIQLERDLKKAQQEHQELERQWKARSEIQQDATRHQKLKAESLYLERVIGEQGQPFSKVVETAREVAEFHPSFDVEDAPHATWFRQFDESVRNAKQELVKQIRQSVESYQRQIESLKTEDSQWHSISEQLNSADTVFREACKRNGLTENDVGHLREIEEAKSRKYRDISSLEKQINDLKVQAGNTNQLLEELYQIWRDQYEKRLEAAERANNLAVLKEDNRKFIEVSVDYQFDQTSFLRLWNDFGPKDGRTSLARAWVDMGNSLIDYFKLNDNTEYASPWELLRKMYYENSGQDAFNLFGPHSESLKAYIMENIERWDELRLSRVKDVVDLKLYRSDGSEAGSISEGSLSDGQRNTAALALLLAQEGGPLVIDQPEDELDSNFVFKELIPMLRKVKANRQIILATHNANLPVNGDAELVYALEAQNGKGQVRTQGGLDNPEVTHAVLDIMEGTEEAFKRRREKYHF